jgi:hypothetical protein
MMRLLRRAFRQWGREFLQFWGRFTAFHRIVIGIMLALVIVFTARSRLLDPLGRKVAAEHKTLADKSVSARVPLPEQDATIAEETLRSENLRRSIANLGGELARAEAVSAFRLNASKADANAALLSLSGKRGLHVLKNLPLEVVYSPSAKTPVTNTASASKGGANTNRLFRVEMSPDSSIPVVASAYEMSGYFAAIYSFLEDAQREPLLWELRDVSITLLNEGETVSGAVPPLLLRFTLVLHLYRGGGS